MLLGLGSMGVLCTHTERVMDGKWFEYAGATDDTKLWRWKEYADTVRQELQRSQRFYLPYGTDLCTDRRFRDVADLLRLPFDVVTVLSSTDCVDKGHPAFGRRIETMTIAVCAEREDSPARRYMRKANWPASNEPWFLMFSLVKETTQKVWMPSTAAVLVSKRLENEDIAIEMHAAMNPMTTDLLASGISPERLVAEAKDDLRAVVELCLLLGLQNVKRISVPAPKGAARARLARGKTPLFDYHVLEVDGERWDGAEYSGNSTHGVRSHLRRGHIRRLDAVRRVWVRACYVRGTETGFVAKDYSLSA